MKTKGILLFLIVLVSLVVVSTALASNEGSASVSETYVVLFKRNSVSADAAKAIAKAGGEMVYSYDQIGVVIARTDDASFATKIAKDKKVEAAAATTSLGTQIDTEFYGMEAGLAVTPVTYDDPLYPLQWGMEQIMVPEAQAINGGSSDVVVGIIDTGIDWTHPDLDDNIDFANSVSCLDGVPNTDPDVWGTGHWHGTHVAGIVAAEANNGIGVIGVAPGVKLAAIQAGNADGYFFPEAVICAFMWAGDHQIDVTNSSYYVDPWLFNCHNDPGQRAIWKAVQRAVRYAMSQGVTVISAAGNENQDLAHPISDATSPDWPPGTEEYREITNACVVLPVELAGVIGVSANGMYGDKAFYSSYGVGAVDVVAPGGGYQGGLPAGLILSTFPGNNYVWAAGTSMASPHAAGVAALIISEYGDMSPGRLQAHLQGTADSQACPPNPYDPYPGGFEANCQGGIGNNSFYGHGRVNAYNAVTHTTN